MEPMVWARPSLKETEKRKKKKEILFIILIFETMAVGL